MALARGDRCRIAFRKMRFDGRYTPPNTDTALMYPGAPGGVNWGSVAVDESRHVMIVNSMNLPMWITLLTRKQVVTSGMERIGGDTHPSLAKLAIGLPQWNTPYGAKYGPFLSPLAAPCMQPPFGTISAVDLDTRKMLWTRPIGLADRMGPMGLESKLPVTIGLPQIGGSVTTAGGLVFIAATPDRRLRAYETQTGRLLWRGDLPASGNANPISYVGRDGRQFVVIAAGGSGIFGPNRRNALVAFALPER